MDAASFLIRFPEFSTIVVPSTTTVDAVLDFWIDDADAFISSTSFGAFRDKAVALYAAHRIATRYKTNMGGMLGQNAPGIATAVNASTGGLSVVNTVSSKVSGHIATDADFARTSYGLEYLMLIEQCIPGGKVVV